MLGVRTKPVDEEAEGRVVIDTGSKKGGEIALDWVAQADLDSVSGGVLDAGGRRSARWRHVGDGADRE